MNELEENLFEKIEEHYKEMDERESNYTDDLLLDIEVLTELLESASELLRARIYNKYR